MRFQKQQLRASAIPELAEQDITPFAFHASTGEIISTARPPAEWALVPLVTMNVESSDFDAQEFAEVAMFVVEGSDIDRPEVTSLQVTGGEIIVDERTVTLGIFKTKWGRRTDVQPVRIPDAIDRLTDFQ